MAPINDIDTNEGLQPFQRPQRQHRRRGSDQMLVFRNILNIIFMILAVVGVVVYIWGTERIGIYIVLTAMAFKITECCLRMLK